VTFDIVCEIEPPTRPDLKHVRHQIGVLSKVASAFLIPDNHIGRATVSSVAVAHEVEQMGGRSIACLNARDRNLLGFRTGHLTVRSMIEELRAFPAYPTGPFRAGVAAGPGPLPAWKRTADFVFAQVRFSLDEMLAWRSSIEFDGPVYAGVMVVPSVAMALKVAADIEQLTVPDAWLGAIERDPKAGVELACELVESVRESGAYDGVHLIPVSRYRDVAARLERPPV
jgi:5,10-methylenetetrahydrofolate reductase